MSPESTPALEPIPTWAKQQANVIDRVRYPHAVTQELFEIYLQGDPTWLAAHGEITEIKQTFYLLVLESEGYPYLSIPNDPPAERL